MSDNKHWVDHIMNELDTASKVTADEDFIIRMQKLAIEQSMVKSKVSKSMLVGIAASLLILFSMNIWIYTSAYNTKGQTELASTDDTREGMYLIPTNFIDYE